MISHVVSGKECNPGGLGCMCFPRPSPPPAKACGSGTLDSSTPEWLVNSGGCSGSCESSSTYCAAVRYRLVHVHLPQLHATLRAPRPEHHQLARITWQHRVHLLAASTLGDVPTVLRATGFVCWLLRTEAGNANMSNCKKSAKGAKKVPMQIKSWTCIEFTILPVLSHIINTCELPEVRYQLNASAVGRRRMFHTSFALLCGCMLYNAALDI